MVRKGRQKVRTGCVTCKVRKIKCDERHPECLKCLNTGRKCDGYNLPPTGSYSWDYLLQPSPSTVTDACDLRGLAFFSQVIIPVLEDPFESSSWSRTAFQASHSEPAVKHAVLAVSSLFESLGSRRPSPAITHRAIYHYNLAIDHLLSSNAPSLDTVLLVCVLFVCTEFLRKDAAGAITHVVHGLSLLGSAGLDSDLACVFRHLSIFPYFFSKGIPNVPSPDGEGSNIPRPPFPTGRAAQASLNLLLHRVIRLVRIADPHRLGLEIDAPSLESIKSVQQCLEQDLHLWGRTYRGVLSEDESPALLLLKVQWLVARIWSNTCLAKTETTYDAHKPNFERIIHLAAMARAQRSLYTTTQRTFSFAMGFCPLLHFVVLKCRFLSMRLTALELMRSLSCLREGMWDRATMLATAERIIEIEHGLEPLNLPEADAVGLQRGLEHEPALPADQQRIRDNMLEEDVQVYQDKHGEKKTKRKIRFLMTGKDGSTETMYDWISIKHEPQVSQ